MTGWLGLRGGGEARVAAHRGYLSIEPKAYLDSRIEQSPHSSQQGWGPPNSNQVHPACLLSDPSHLLPLPPSRTELFPYQRVILYGVVTSIMCLDRVALKKRVVDAPEILTVIHQIPHLAELLNSLYFCKYKEFFRVSCAAPGGGQAARAAQGGEHGQGLCHGTAWGMACA